MCNKYKFQIAFTLISEMEQLLQFLVCIQLLLWQLLYY